jgi:hypothetical protein
MIETNKKNFRPQILQNLAAFPGYVENHDHIESLNNILNELDIMGFEKLEQNFCTQIDPDNAEDFLFEVWICRMLLKNQAVQKLQYEPEDEIHPPDFRFCKRHQLRSRGKRIS